MTRFLALSLGLAVFPLASASVDQTPELPRSVKQFFDFNCFECHNEVDKKGELDLEGLLEKPFNRSTMKHWSIIFDRIRDEEMPPKEDFEVEPQERAEFLARFETILHDVSAKRQAAIGRVHTRRLNRIEFENTLRDLVGVDFPMRDLLPTDAEHDGFSNVAEAQQVSYQLLAKYLEVVDAALETAVSRVVEPPPPYKRELSAADLSTELNAVKRTREAHFYDGHAVSIASRKNYHGRMPATSVPEDGWYRIRVRAKAHNPPPGRGVWTQIRSGMANAKAPLFYWVGSFEAGDEPQEFVFETWMLKNHMLELRPGDRTLKFTDVKLVDDGTAIAKGAIGTAVEWLEIERIDRGSSPEAIQKRLFGDLPIVDGQLVSSRPNKDLQRLIEQFAERAFRRPVPSAELADYYDFAKAAYVAKGSLIDGVLAGYRAIMCSPNFLFFAEEPGKLDDYGIASRLSYFLWSSMPDDALLAAAKSGRLSDPAVIGQQVERMLKDPRSEAFVRNFTDSWLNLKDIDFTSPDVKLYPEFDDILKHSMVAETRAFLGTMLDENLSVLNVVDSDFAMLNERLAKHYRIGGVNGTEIRKVPLEAAYRRGGIITQGSILKVTANGTTTSPVLRGLWLLERILGEHVPPPPDNVGSVEPDIRGAVSIRDQLDKHRSSSSCISCHLKIDPPGFALENYDVIGGWRQHYRAIEAGERWYDGQPVDASYEMPDGASFSDIDGFKKLILSDPDQIARNLVEKIMVYATGASVEFADRREIERIVDDLAENGYGFRSLVQAVAGSSVFLSK